MSTNQQWAQSMMERLQVKLPYAMEKAQGLDFIPYTTENNEWKPAPMDGICWWTNGFWPAIMWQMYAQTQDEQYMAEARRSQQMLNKAFQDFPHLHHDVGFMWRISTGFDYELTFDTASRETTLFAANLLAGRYNPNGFIRAWNDDKAGWAIIDCMMNLSLLYWASEQTGDPRFQLIARRHADTVLKHFIREDGTSEHIVVFDPETGDVLRKPRGQGYGQGTVWSRGQAWALYGFAISYAHTGDKRYLDTAIRVAKSFIEHVSSDWLPDCDFRAPKEPVVKDDCAGAIAACGLLEISEQLGDTPTSLEFEQAAYHLLKALCEQHADWSLQTPSILQRCTGAYHDKSHHIAMVYGDYFLIEGIIRLLGSKNLRW